MSRVRSAFYLLPILAYSLTNPTHALTQADETAFIVLVDENDNSTLVRARVHMDKDIYTRQQGALFGVPRQPTAALAAAAMHGAAASGRAAICTTTECRRSGCARPPA